MRLFISFLVVALLSACSIGPITSNTYEATQGQQLLDLKKAWDEGVISEDEYHRERAEILYR